MIITKYHATFMDGPQAGKSMMVDGLQDPPRRILLHTIDGTQLVYDMHEKSRDTTTYSFIQEAYPCPSE